jgi:hypothetical protein
MVNKQIKCPYFRMLCLRENCVAFNAFTTEKFTDLQGNRVGITKIRELYKEYGLKYLQDNLWREYRVWEECAKLGKVIDDRTERDHNIPSYVYEE